MKTKEKVKKKKIIKLIRNIILYSSMFIFAWHVVEPQIIIWTIEISTCNGFCIFLALRILMYCLGSLFIVVKLIELDFVKMEKRK